MTNELVGIWDLLRFLKHCKTFHRRGAEITEETQSVSEKLKKWNADAADIR